MLINVVDASPYDIAYQLYDFVADAINSSPENKSASHANWKVKKKLEALTGVYDRPGMPERVMITTNGRTLLVADLFGTLQVESLEWV